MRKAIFLLILIGVVLSLTFVRAVISNKISTSGVELSSINFELKTYRTENTLLKEKINVLSSLTYLYEKATKNGFTESKSIFAISSTRPLALKQ